MIAPSPVRLTMLFVGDSELVIADDIRDQNRRELPGLAHCAALKNSKVSRTHRQITRAEAVAGFSTRRTRQKPISTLRSVSAADQVALEHDC
jgi:hypothetical protein